MKKVLLLVFATFSSITASLAQQTYAASDTQYVASVEKAFSFM